MRTMLEAQCDRVDAILRAHGAPGRVIGGTVGPDGVCLHFQGAPFVRLVEVAAWRDDLAAGLRAPELCIQRSSVTTADIVYGGKTEQRETAYQLTAERR